MIGFLAAGLVIATLSMRTMIPLRIIGLASNVAFVAYGALFGSIPTVILYKGGQAHAQKVGALTKSQLTAFLDSNL